jgi:hypothetical protein
MTEWLLPLILPNDTQKKAARSLALGVDVPYVRMAERAISGAVAGTPLMGDQSASWHLEDPDGETIDDEYTGDPRAIEAYTLVDQPFKYLDVPSPLRTRRQLWEITSRHMGLAGYGFWILDGMDPLGIPRSVIYCRPDRIVPDTNDQGVLTKWILDPRPGPGGRAEGRELDPNEVVQFQFQPPDVGYMPAGLIESAIMKVQLSGTIDKYFASLLSGGGRLSGILSPKTGAIEDDGVYQQMVRDWRNITEQPESGKRVQVVRGPIEFTRTTATTVEMALVDFLKQNEADLLAVWGVPLSQLGGYTPTGLNSGDVRKYDRQAMWENAIIPRLAEIQESVQGRILDRFEALLGWAPQLVLDIPALNDDSARFDKLAKAQWIALTNDERRDLIGKDPLDDETVGKRILMPNTLIPIEDLMPGASPPIPSGGGSPAPGAGPRPAAPATPAPAPATAATAAVQPPAGVQATKAKGDVTQAVLGALRKQWSADSLSQISKGDWKYDPAYPLDKIDYARRPIARNPKTVQAVAAALGVGAPIDPVVLVKTKRIGGSGADAKPTEPIDGWHRLLGAEHAGLTHVPAYIGKGDDQWTRDLIAIDDTLPAPQDAGSRGKAATVRSRMQGLRERVQKAQTPVLRASVAGALEQMKRDVVSRVLTKYDAIRRTPGDTTIWWNAKAHDQAMTAALSPTLTNVAVTVDDHIRTVMPTGKAAFVPVGGPPQPAAVTYVLAKGAGRVTKINETTRDGLKEIIDDGLEEGASPATLGDMIQSWFGWDEYRAERIATTELMFAYNAAAVSTYGDMGVTQVEAIDGDDDDVCAERDGQTYSVEEAADIEDHPNGTLDWVPVIETMDEGSTEGEGE